MSDYALFETIYAKGDKYVAAEGDCLFGNEVYGIPAGILETVTATVTALNGTVVYSGTADLR